MAVQRYSRQRELIYNAVRASRDHPTAEMVYAALKGDHPNLSLGTVYRNLHLLAREGKLRRMPFPVERFDGEVTPHHHFCCEACGRVMDVSLPYDASLDRAAAGCGLVTYHATVFYGLCTQCRQAEQAAKPPRCLSPVRRGKGQNTKKEM